MTQSLLETLLKRAQEDKLAHFYIMECGANEAIAKKELSHFIEKFITEYFSKIEFQKNVPAQIQNHPNVFILGQAQSDENEKDFTVFESMELARFFEFKSVYGKRKFAIISDAHRINNVVANKWLKLLEDPQGMSTIFLLNPRGKKLLETISSRAIYLRLPHKKEIITHKEWDLFLTDIKNLGLSGFLEKYAKNSEELEKRVQDLIDWESQQLTQQGAKESLKKWLSEFQEMDTFHQPGATKWSLFYSYLKEQVLPRVIH